MSDNTNMFGEDAKVVISPDEMRAWVSLPPPPTGVQYTAAAILEWLPQNGVVYGIDNRLVQQAVDSERYFELLEVARGTPPVEADGGSYTLLVEKIPFSGLRGNPDGSLYYDDLSFLQEAQPEQVLATITPATPGQSGTAVTGKQVEPKEAQAAKTLAGSGFAVSEDGCQYTAPSLSHVAVVNDKLVVTPLLKLPQLTPENGKIVFDGNLLVEGDVAAGSSVEVSGSVFVQGRTSTCDIQAGRNVLLCGGMRADQGFGSIKAKENVWGLHFESVNINAGGDICANHLAGCDVSAGGRASILGGRGSIADTQLYAKNGVVAIQLGNERSDATLVQCGMAADLIERFDAVDKKMAKLAQDVQTSQQNLTAYERVNRNKPGGGKQDAAYKEMASKKEQQLSVLGILDAERTRLKRVMDQFSAVSIIVRQTAFPGVTVAIDTRTFEVVKPLTKVKFKRNMDVIEIISITSR